MSAEHNQAKFTNRIQSNIIELLHFDYQTQLNHNQILPDFSDCVCMVRLHKIALDCV